MRTLLHKYFVVFLILTTGFGFQSCKKNWLDVNYNPRDLTGTSATPELILPALMERMVPGTSNAGLQEWMGYWSHWNIPPNANLVTYNRPEINGTTLGSLQANPPAEIFFLETRSRESNQAFYLGISKVLRALAWSQAVDMMNNMPYSEAFNQNILQPKYDDARSIYDNLFVHLDSAVTLIKNSTEADGIKINLTDIMFHGDKLMWAKFINTLKLRLLIHQANRPDRQEYITTQIQKIIEEGSGFLGTGESANVNPGYSEKPPNQVNPYFGGFSSHNFIYGGGFYDVVTQVTSAELAHANLFAMELLKKNNDPRLSLFYSPIEMPVPAGADEPYGQSAPDDFRGNKFGFSNNPTIYPYQDAAYVSPVGGSRNIGLVNDASMGIIKGRNMDSWIITSTESLFLQAEAIQRGWLDGDAEQAYKDAVKESFRWLNAGGSISDPSASDAVFDTWYDEETNAMNSEVSWSAAADKYKLLMFQKYLAFNGIEPLETWTDYRRNGRFPDLPRSAATTVVGNAVPVRVLYNAQEYVTNSKNVTAQGTIDIFTSKIWWMP